MRRSSVPVMAIRGVLAIRDGCVKTVLFHPGGDVGGREAHIPANLHAGNTAGPGHFVDVGLGNLEEGGNLLRVEEARRRLRGGLGTG
jgi:hypothetical protein